MAAHLRVLFIFTSERLPQADLVLFFNLNFGVPLRFGSDRELVLSQLPREMIIQLTVLLLIVYIIINDFFILVQSLILHHAGQPRKALRTCRILGLRDVASSNGAFLTHLFLSRSLSCSC